MAVNDSDDKGVQGRISCLRVQQRYLLQSLEQAQAEIAKLQTQLVHAEQARDAARHGQVEAETARYTSQVQLKAEHESEIARNRAKISSLENQLQYLQERSDRLLQDAFDRAQMENEMAAVRDLIREKNDIIGELRLEIERLQRLRDVQVQNIEELRLTAVDHIKQREMAKELQRLRTVASESALKEEQIIGLEDKNSRLEKSLAEFATMSEKVHQLEHQLLEWRNAYCRVSDQTTLTCNADPFELVRFCNALKEEKIKLSARLKQSQDVMASLQQEVSLLHSDSVRLRSERSGLETKLSELQNQLMTVSAENARLRLENEGLQGMIASYESEKVANGKTAAEDVETMKELERLRSVEAEVANLRETCDFLQRQNELQDQVKRQAQS